MFRYIVFWLTALSLGGSGVAAASDAEAVATSNQALLTLRRAVELALQHNVQLKATDAARAAERARGDALALGPQYRVGAEFENFAGTGELSGADSLESTLSLASVVELGGKRERRLDVAASRLEVADAEARVRRLDVAAGVGRRYVDVVRSEALVALGRDNVAVAAAHRRCGANALGCRARIESGSRKGGDRAQPRPSRPTVGDRRIARRARRALRFVGAGRTGLRHDDGGPVPVARVRTDRCAVRLEWSGTRT